MLTHGDLFDGYRLIRQIGSGGFGEVWLCRSETVGDLKAVKFVTATQPELLEKELSALVRYRQAANELRTPNLMPIEHINRSEHGLFYVMPLADGQGAPDPHDPEWVPWTFERMIQGRQGEWFSSAEIAALMTPILAGLQAISDAGLVHRDVKPANILFLGGHPCLADISLLGEDSLSITRRGTPGYLAPSWYMEAGGSPDMFGAATTLYTLLTGNPPDKLGRSKFWWPPQGEASLSPVEHSEWKRLHTVIRRAVEESSRERFIDFKAIAEALNPTRLPRATYNAVWIPPAVAALILVTSLILIGVSRRGEQTSPLPVTVAESGAPPSAPAKSIELPISEPARIPSEPATEPPPVVTGSKMDIFGSSIADFDREIGKQIAWTRSYHSEYSKEANILLEKLKSVAGSDYLSPEDRMKTLREINSAIDAILAVKPELTSKAISEKLGQWFEAQANEVLVQAKSREDRTFFFEHVKPELIKKFEASFDGLTPGEHFTGTFQGLLEMAFMRAMNGGLDLVPPTAGSLSSGIEPAKRTDEEKAALSAIKEKIKLFEGY